MIIRDVQAILIPKETIPGGEDCYLPLYFASTRKIAAPNGKYYHRFAWLTPSHLSGQVFFTKESMEEFMESDSWKNQPYQTTGGTHLSIDRLTSMMSRALDNARTIEEIGSIGVDGPRNILSSSNLYRECKKAYKGTDILFDRGDYNVDWQSRDELTKNFFALKTYDGEFIGKSGLKASSFEDIDEGVQSSTEGEVLDFIEANQRMLGFSGYDIVEIKGMSREDATEHLMNFKISRDAHWRTYFRKKTKRPI